jgi:UDP-N-acetylmuramyl tripeptide synthase
MMSDAVVTRLIDAQVSLTAAIEELDSINVDRNAFDQNVYNNLSRNHAETRHEVIARYAIGKAETLLKIHNPSKMDNVLARLRMEFAAIFGRKALGTTE